MDTLKKIKKITKEKKPDTSNYNTTQLHPEMTFERHVFHRDQFAHYLRWTHVLNQATIGKKILDFGTGNGNIYEVFYRNRYSPKKFIGLDIRKQTIKKNEEKFPKAEWYVEDLVKMKKHYGKDWDFITSFEVAEHVGKKNVGKFLDNIADHCNKNTTVLISTPCYDPEVGAADNHIYDGGPQELTYSEMEKLVSKRFKIEKVFGTFASQKDYKKLMDKHQKKLFDQMGEYYDSNLMSVIFAPLFPKQSRNCMWRLKLK